MNFKMRKVESIILLLLVFILLPITSIYAGNDAMGHGDASEVVVALVNGEKINMSQLMTKMQEVAEKKYGTRGISPLLASKIKKEATDKLIVEELAYQKAKGVIKVTPEMIEAHIVAVKNKYGGDEGFAKYLEDEGTTLSELKVQAERFLAVKHFVEKEIDSKIVISDQEIIDAYQGANGKYFMQKESVQVNSIIFFLEPGAPDTKDKIAKVVQRIKDETDNDPTQLTPDGTFIVQKSIKLDKVREAKSFEVARVLKEYEFSEPFESDGTVYVLQLTGYKPEIVKTMEEVIPYLRSKITKERRRALLNNWMVSLKDGAEIEIMDLNM